MRQLKCLGYGIYFDKIFRMILRVLEVLPQRTIPLGVIHQQIGSKKEEREKGKAHNQKF